MREQDRSGHGSAGRFFQPSPQGYRQQRIEPLLEQSTVGIEPRGVGMTEEIGHQGREAGAVELGGYCRARAGDGLRSNGLDGRDAVEEGTPAAGLDGRAEQRPVDGGDDAMGHAFVHRLQRGREGVGGRHRLQAGVLQGAVFVGREQAALLEAAEADRGRGHAALARQRGPAVERAIGGGIGDMAARAPDRGRGGEQQQEVGVRSLGRLLERGRDRELGRENRFGRTVGDACGMDQAAERPVDRGSQPRAGIGRGEIEGEAARSHAAMGEGWDRRAPDEKEMPGAAVDQEPRHRLAEPAAAARDYIKSVGRDRGFRRRPG